MPQDTAGNGILSIFLEKLVSAVRSCSLIAIGDNIITINCVKTIDTINFGCTVNKYTLNSRLVFMVSNQLQLKMY